MPHEAVPKVWKGKVNISQNRILCDNLDWLNFFLMTRTKLASVGFVAARNCMRHQVLDDAKSLPLCGRSQSATTCDSSYAPNSAQYYSSTSQYCSVLLCTTKCYSSTTLYYEELSRATKYFSSTTQDYSSTTLYYKVLLRAEKSYMKFHWHCEKQQASLSNLTKLLCLPRKMNATQNRKT